MVTELMAHDDMQIDNSSALDPSHVFGFVDPQFRYTLRGATYTEPPYAEECFPRYPENCTFPGYDVAYVVRVLNNIGIKLVMKSVEEDYLLPYMLTGSADIVVQTEAVTTKFSEYLPMSPVVSVERPAFFVKAGIGKGGGGIADMHSVFHWYIPVGFALCSLITVVIEGFYYLFDKWVGESASEALPVRFNTLGKLNQFMIYLFLAIFLNVYSSLLAIGFAINVNSVDAPFPDLNTLAQMWYDGKCKIMTYDDMLVEMQESVFPSEEILRTRIDSGEEIRPLDKLLVSAAKRHKPIIVQQSDYRRFLSWIVNNESCLVHIDYESRKKMFLQTAGDQLTFVVDPLTKEIHYVYFLSPYLDLNIATLINTAFAAGSAADSYDENINRLVAIGKTGKSDPEELAPEPERYEDLHGIRPLKFKDFDLSATVFALAMGLSILLWLFERIYFHACSGKLSSKLNDEVNDKPRYRKETRSESDNRSTEKRPLYLIDSTTSSYYSDTHFQKDFGFSPETYHHPHTNPLFTAD